MYVLADSTLDRHYSLDYRAKRYVVGIYFFEVDIMTWKSLADAESEARAVVNAWTAGAGLVGWIPGSMLVLAAADMKLVNDVAKAFGVQSYTIEEVTAAIGASVTGKIVAGELLSFIPVLGWAVKSGVAAAVTKAVGETVIAYMRDRSPYR